jgi:hypothetical protein
MKTTMEEEVAKAIHKAMPGRENSIAPYTPLTLLLARVAIDAVREYEKSHHQRT